MHYSKLIDFEYNEGKLIKVIHSQGYDIIEYNSNDLPFHITLYTSDGALRGVYDLEYDSMNRLISYRNRTLEYEGRNVSRVISTVNPDYVVVFEYEYDNERNPIELFDVSFLTRYTEYLHFPEYISPNNITMYKRYGPDGSLTESASYHYEYDRDGYPVKRIDTLSYYNGTMSYVYEDL